MQVRPYLEDGRCVLELQLARLAKADGAAGRGPWPQIVHVYPSSAPALSPCLPVEPAAFGAGGTLHLHSSGRAAASLDALLESHRHHGHHGHDGHEEHGHHHHDGHHHSRHDGHHHHGHPHPARLAYHDEAEAAHLAKLFHEIARDVLAGLEALDYADPEYDRPSLPPPNHFHRQIPATARPFRRPIPATAEACLGPFLA